jgi:predicted component of type VI protein secretion system
MTEDSLDSWKNIAAQYAQNADYWRERAERAEALCDAVVQTYETRLARVRELVDEADGEPKRLFWPSEILAAIEGPS